MEGQNKKEKAKKQLLLRLSPALWQELAAWAEDDFRSINGQIEYLLTECVKKEEKELCFLSGKTGRMNKADLR